MGMPNNNLPDSSEVVIEESPIPEVIGEGDNSVDVDKEEN